MTETMHKGFIGPSYMMTKIYIPSSINLAGKSARVDISVHPCSPSVPAITSTDAQAWQSMCCDL